MRIIATYWYVWLVIMIIGYVYALLNQLQMMGSMIGSSNLADGNLLRGAGKMFISGAVGFGAMVLLFISIILNIIW